MTNFYSRADWGARPAKKAQAAFSPSAVTGVCVHYVGGGSMVGANIPQHLRNTQVFYFNGANSKDDYSDIAYNVGVDLDGNVWELRGWTIRGGANGTTGSNASFPSIYLVMGNLDTPSEAMIRGVRAAIERFRSLFPYCSEIHGHQEFYGTACPGPAMDLVRNGTFEPTVSVSSPSADQELEPMYFARPHGYWDAYLFGAGEPKHVSEPSDAQFLVDAGKIVFNGQTAHPGQPYTTVTEVWPLSLMQDVSGFNPANGLPSGE